MLLCRNGAMVNLPWALLVKGDVVLIKPGQISPARLLNEINNRHKNSFYNYTVFCGGRAGVNDHRKIFLF